MKLLKVLRSTTQYEPDLLLIYFFERAIWLKPYCPFAAPWFLKIGWMPNFKGRYGSITDNTVHSVQMDNTGLAHNIESLLSRFWWPNVQLVLCLNVLAKLQNPKEASCHPALMGNCSTCSHIPLGPINPLNGLLSVCSRWCATMYEILWPRERCLLTRKLTWSLSR